MASLLKVGEENYDFDETFNNTVESLESKSKSF